MNNFLHSGVRRYLKEALMGIIEVEAEVHIIKEIDFKFDCISKL